MPHFLDVGFHWTDTTASGSPPGHPTDAATLSYAFERDGGGGQGEAGVAAGQKDFSTVVNDRLEVRVLELTKTPGVELVNIEIEFENIGHTDHTTPTSKLSGLHEPNHPLGKQDFPSTGLNSQGSAWFPTGAQKLKNPGNYLVTVRVRASMHGDDRHWIVDPKLIVGAGP